MTVDPEVVAALSKSLAALKDNKQGSVPVDVIEALAPLAKPGAAVKIDMEASAVIGAPLVTVAVQPESSHLLAPLSRRQREVAQHLIAGKSNKDIATALSISVATVKDHVHAILRQLDLPSRSAVIAAARG